MNERKFKRIAEELPKIDLKIEIPVPGSRPFVMSPLTIQQFYFQIFAN